MRKPRLKLPQTFFSKILLCLLAAAPAAARLQNDTLRLIFAGDIMNNKAMLDAACLQTNKKYDYQAFFKYIRPTLESADIAIGNLELTMPGKPPYTGFPKFRSPDVLADALKTAGFDVLVTANNHSNDSGAGGVAHTIEVLRKRKFLQTGTFRNAAERETGHPLILTKRGFKIALLNYTHHTNGLPTAPPVIVNRISSRQIYKDLALARALQPDFIIVFLHWGEEHELRENSAQRRLAKYLARHGADLVVGAHPHVVQPIRRESATLPDGTTRSALVAYSLGNFISNMYQPDASGGILLRVNLVKKRQRRGAWVQDFGYVAHWRYIQKVKNGRARYFVLPVAKVERDPKLVAGMSERSRLAMLRFVGGLRRRLKCSEKKW